VRPSNLREATSLAFHDGAGRKDFLQGGDDVSLAQVHAERGDLDDEDVLIFVHDEAAEEIALGALTTRKEVAPGR